MRLRQIAPAEGDAGALARYALARAHADWLILGLVHNRENDGLLRLLAVDLGVEGASPDDQLSLSQVHSCMDRVREEVGLAGAAGTEARQWASAMGDLLDGLREGWESFAPGLFQTIVQLGGEPGPARIAADTLAVGWAAVALEAAATRPAPERAAFVARMAGYFDTELVEALADDDGSLWDGDESVACTDVDRRLGGLSPRERLTLVRSSCSGAAHGFSEGVGEVLSPELAVGAALLRDLAERRSRLEAEESDPLRLAAVPVLVRFDAALLAFRLPLPLPVPGPRLPTVAVAPGPVTWSPTGAVVTLQDSGAVHVALWPTLASLRGEVMLLDVTTELALPGRPAGENLGAALDAVFAQAGESLGIEERSVTLVAPADSELEPLLALLGAFAEANVSSVGLLVRWGDAEGQGQLPLTLGRGEARSRTSSDRRAVVVLRPNGVLVSIDDDFADLQDGDDGLPAARITASLAEHLEGRGNAGCVVAVRPGVNVERMAAMVDLLARAPRAATEDAARGWQIWLDPEDPPTPMPVAETAADAVAQRRPRLRRCYERYLRGGGDAQGTLVLELSLGAGGTVDRARVAETELGPQPALDSCLLGEAQRIRFPEDTDVPTVRVPLRFVPR